MSNLLFKIIAFVVILLTGFIGGFFSIKLTASSKREKIFSLGNAFAGGIFLGAGLIHMLPDAQEGFDSFLAGVDFPWVSLICALGFLLVLFIEKVLFTSNDAIAEAEGKQPGKLLYPYILTLVLSVHSIIAGIALGTEGKIMKGVIILIAVLAHKGSAAFALGVSLVRAEILKSKIKRIITLFCFTTPLGLVIGSLFIILMTGKTELVVTSIFDALAAGTFLYVALLDILNEEFKVVKDRFIKFVLVLLGLGLMALLAIWV